MPEPATPEQVLEAVTLLRSEVVEIGEKSLDPDVKVRVLKALDDQEDLNQKAVKAAEHTTGLERQIGEQKEAIDVLTSKVTSVDELKSQIGILEALIAQRPGNHSDPNAYKDDTAYKALEAWAKRPDALTPEEKAEMRTDVGTAGGFLAPTEFDTALQKEIVEIDAVRSLARVKTIAAKAVEMAVRTDIPRALYEGEAELASTDISSYRLVTVTPFRQTVIIPTTLDMLMNGAFDMEQELVQDAGEGFAEGEGQGFIAGSGNKTPEGVTQNATVIANMSLVVDLSAIATDDDDLFANAIMDLSGKLKVGYNASYNFHRTTLARIRQLRDGAGGQFLWQPGLNGAASNTLNGSSYVLTPSLDPWNTGTGDVMIYGDWSRGYTIVDRTGLAIVRDEVTEAGKAIVKFTLHRWNTGLVTIPEAFQMMRNN